MTPLFGLRFPRSTPAPAPAPLRRPAPAPAAPEPRRPELPRHAGAPVARPGGLLRAARPAVAAVMLGVTGVGVLAPAVAAAALR